MEPVQNKFFVKPSESVSFICQFFGGKPKPTAKWFFNEKLINEEQNKKYSIEEYTLEVKNISKNDQGSYTCILSNNYHSPQSINYTLIIGNI